MPSRFISKNVLVVLSILWTIFPLEMSKCSEVIDKLIQKDGLYMSDYCPKIASCPEGSHVMCMFYNPNSIMGPGCSNFQNISITPDKAQKMLKIVNAIRSKIARGKETGKDGKLLPKGYGMFRLKWDSELATFAQVLANQCILRHDICRASKKFPDPGQAAGLVRFSYPRWLSVSSTVVFNETGLTKTKVIYATTQSMKSWYSHKTHVTPEMISKYPDWTKHPNDLNGRLYLEMMYGAATHMGCGISAYSEFAYHTNRARMIYNSIQTICNFSSRPRKGKAVYQSTPPTGPGYTARCGCPEGYEEGADCLCSETSSPSEMCGKKSCSPNVVLLPIFTVEDAPRSVLDDQPPEPSIVISDSYRRNNSTSIAIQENSIDDIFGPYESYGYSVDRTTRSPILNPTMHYVQQDASSTVKVINEPHNHIQYLRPPEPSVDIPNSYRRNNSASTAIQGNSIDDIFGLYESYGSRIDRTTRTPVLSPSIDSVQQDTSNAVKVISEPQYHTQYLRPNEKKTLLYDIDNDNIRKRESRSEITKMRSTSRQQLRDVKNRYFNKQIPGSSQRHPQTQSLQTGYSHVQKGKPTLRIRPSIFSRSSTFRLPRYTGTNSFPFRSDIKKDVAPRKNFTKGKQILSTYLTKKRNHEDLSNKAFGFSIQPSIKNKVNIQPRFKINKTTEVYNKPTKKFNRYLINKFHYQDFNVSHQPRNDIEIENSNEEADIKLMTLLDTLEQEVKHIELIGNKKEIFDAKIRKIYDTVLNKKEETNLNSPLHTRTEQNQEDAGYKNYVKYESDVKNHLVVDHTDDRSKEIRDKRIYKSEKQVSEINSKLSDTFSDPKSLFSKKTKARNSLLSYDENDKALTRHYKEPISHDIYETETEDQNYPNNFEKRNEMPYKSMMKYVDTNKNILENENQKIKNYRDDGQESDLRGRDNTNNNKRNADKIHDYDDYTVNNRNFNQNKIKPRNDNKNYNYRDTEKHKYYDYRDTEKGYDEDVKSIPPFRQPLDIELKNRGVDKTINDYRYTKKRSSDDNMKNKNQLRQFIGDNSLKNRNVYRNNEGQSRHNYDDESMKKHNFDENLIELRRNENVMRRDRANEFRTSYKDYGNIEREVSHDRVAFERRKFYQNKLDNIEKKLNSRSYSRRTERDKERALRLDRPHQNELHMRPSSKGQNQFYIPDRARILHGF